MVSKLNASSKPQISEFNERHSSVIPTGAKGARALFYRHLCPDIKIVHMMLRLHFLPPQQIPKNRADNKSLTLATAFPSKLA